MAKSSMSVIRERAKETVAREKAVERAKLQGQAQYDSIAEMVQRLRVAEDQAVGGPDETEAARRWIEEDALSVEVRSGWELPSAFRETSDKHGFPTLRPAEYCVLLCTGGPACRIVGELDANCEPETARMQVQDWFQPWTDFEPKDFAEDVLLAYAGAFWYGE